MRRLVTLMILLLPVAAPGQDWPALYSVTGVAEDDVLYIRSEPGAQAAPIGSFAPDARMVEVTRVSENGDWARVNTMEREGWASLSYLSREREFSWPMPVRCYGTEPAWSLILPGDAPVTRARYSTPFGESATYEMTNWLTASNRADRVSFLSNTGPSGQVAGVLRATECSDGMSDRAFGMAIDMLRSGDDAVHLTGCCTLEMAN